MQREPRWNWVLTKRDNCADCLRRAGMAARTWAAWTRIGLPKTGFSVCGDNCGCELSKTEAIGIALEDYLPDGYKSMTPREKAKALRAAAKKLREEGEDISGLITELVLGT